MCITGLRLPVPPPGLRLRVSGNDDVDEWLRVGTASAPLLVETARKTADRAVVDVLDWGCGSGRLAASLAAGYPELRLSGCDPDHEAISWCKKNISGQFAVSSLYPPLAYQAESFDAVFGLSVMTHLRRRVQRRWLGELHRVLRPGGVFLATVHGATAASEFGVEKVTGIEDHYLDPFMVDVLPADYYRTVLQTQAYTRDAWSDWFEIVAYEEAAVDSHDLVVCRRAG